MNFVQAKLELAERYHAAGFEKRKAGDFTGNFTNTTRFSSRMLGL